MGLRVWGLCCTMMRLEGQGGRVGGEEPLEITADQMVTRTVTLGHQITVRGGELTLP